MRIRSHTLLSIIAYTIASIYSLFLIYRFTVFMLQNAVNAPYYDMILIMLKFTQNPSLASLYMFQHVTHYQGIGYILLFYVASLTHWSIPSLTVLSLIVQNGILINFLIITHRVFKRVALFDVVIPLILFSYKYFELFSLSPNISTAVLPMYFLSVIGLLLTHSSKWQYLWIAFVSFLLIFSGYGMIAIIPIGIIFLNRIYLAYHTGEHNVTILWTSFVFFSFSVLQFITHYSFTDVSECSLFPLGNYSLYPEFAGRIIASTFVDYRFLTPTMIGIGIFLYVALLIQTLIKGVRLFLGSHKTNNDIYAFQFLCYAFSLLFISFATIGRSCYGTDFSAAPRYAYFFIPTLIAIYYDVVWIRNKHVSIVLSVILICALWYSNLSTYSLHTKAAAEYRRKLNQWARCYREYESIAGCASSDNFILIDEGFTEEASRLFHYAKTHNLLFYNSSFTP